MPQPRNEAYFSEYINFHWPLILRGKVSWKRGDVSISTDFHIETEKYVYLIEIDASNQAKLIVGQYLLINMLYGSTSKSSLKTFNKTNKPVRFIIIHFFSKYNPNRSNNNLTMANNEMLNGNGIEFGSIHFNEFVEETQNLGGLTQFETFFEALIRRS